MTQEFKRLAELAYKSRFEPFTLEDVKEWNVLIEAIGLEGWR